MDKWPFVVGNYARITHGSIIHCARRAGGEIGRRMGLKIPSSQGRAGSIPTPRTTLICNLPCPGLGVYQDGGSALFGGGQGHTPWHEVNKYSVVIGKLLGSGTATPFLAHLFRDSLANKLGRRLSQQVDVQSIEIMN